MRLLSITAFTCAAALLPLAAHAQHAAHEWDYRGKQDPAHWGDLKPDYATCKLGKHQSPIDIRATSKAALPPLGFDYRSAPLTVLDNGHTIQVNVAPGSGVDIGGSRYELLQFHFHTPSEERINGKQYPLVAHLVHKNGEGRLAVVAVLFKLGKEHPLLSTVWSAIPTEKGAPKTVEGKQVDASALLPARQGYYNFEGSLTTPPCSEDVNWFVLKTPVEMSKGQLDAFHKIYKHNARPVQALNGRVVKESS